MLSYLLKRILLIVPTLFGIMLINFLIVQAAPGGPVEQMIAKAQGIHGSATDRFAGTGSETMGADTDAGMKGAGNADAGNSKYRGAQGLDPAFIAELETRDLASFDESLRRIRLIEGINLTESSIFLKTSKVG